MKQDQFNRGGRQIARTSTDELPASRRLFCSASLYGCSGASGPVDLRLTVGHRSIAAVVVGRLRLADFVARIVATATQRDGQADQ
ncbi:hypothetical protein A5648_05855 [Mycolicibacter sinensis]|uniref:Uncharacterized protein n=1 Tax=Mycolicibacter sinensis (strain JDM601) TaxID=875328 RepID=A0A1A3TUM5_MYCSD|nr:hypothetical protein A5648_05855 [Mycolicibacter sinensis]